MKKFGKILLGMTWCFVGGQLLVVGVATIMKEAKK